MLLKSLFLVFLFSFSVFQAIASSSTELLPVESLQMQAPTEGRPRWTFSTFLEIPAYTLLISTDAGRVNGQKISQRVQYSPTFGPNLGFTARRDQLWFSLSKKFSFVDEAEQKIYGKTNYDHLRLGFHLAENLLIETYYQSYQGFYTDLSGEQGFKTTVGPQTSNPNSATKGESAIINRSDLKALSYGVRATAALSVMPFVNLFETNAASKRSVWQMNLLGKLYYNRQGITADSALVPESLSSAFSPIASLKEFWSNTIGVGAGLGCVIPISDSFDFGFDATLGGGFQRQTHVFADRESVAYTFAQEMNAKMYTKGEFGKHAVEADIYMDMLSSKVDDLNLDATSVGTKVVYTYTGF